MNTGGQLVHIVMSTVCRKIRPVNILLKRMILTLSYTMKLTTAEDLKTTPYDKRYCLHFSNIKRHIQ